MEISALQRRIEEPFVVVGIKEMYAADYQVAESVTKWLVAQEIITQPALDRALEELNSK